MTDFPTHPHLGITIEAIHYFYPIIAFVYFLLSKCIAICTLQTSLGINGMVGRISVLILLVLGGYVAEGLGILARALYHGELVDSEHHIVYILGSLLVWGLELYFLMDTLSTVWYPYYGIWFFGIGFEIMLLIGSIVIRSPYSFSSAVMVAIQATRLCILVALPCLYLALGTYGKRCIDGAAEGEPLRESSVAQDNDYWTCIGGAASASAPDTDVQEAREILRKRLLGEGDWWAYTKRFAIFVPYIWPSQDKMLQLRAILVGACLLVQNILNVLIPYVLGLLIDSWGKPTEATIILCAWIGLRFLGSNAGLPRLRNWLWLAVEVFSLGSLRVALTSHLYTLEEEWHHAKNSVALRQAVCDGNEIFDLLDIICFRFLPLLIDIVAACMSSSWLFGPYMGLLLAYIITIYLCMTAKFLGWIAPYRRGYIKHYEEETRVAHEGLTGLFTSKMFNKVPYEAQRHASVVGLMTNSQSRWYSSYWNMGAAQSLLMSLGLLCAGLLAVHQSGTKTKGDFVTLISYWTQLYGPLTSISNLISNASKLLIDAERMLLIFETKPSLTDHPNAKPLDYQGGNVTFKEVTFAYRSRERTIENVSFVAPPGKTTAIVGETGGGKSTLLKLILRYYDITSGEISIDGQDIRAMQQESLREHFSYVPQEPHLYDETIMYNVRYSKMDATDEDVHNACKAAAIHEKIMSFSDDYNTQVGTNGVKLSGGEKQRIAIARALLRNSKMVLLDEATNAVDVKTERDIQNALKALCKDRTTIIVAHRLSTIRNADQIIVVDNGKIIEQGSFLELLSVNGKFHELWSEYHESHGSA